MLFGNASSAVEWLVVGPVSYTHLGGVILRVAHEGQGEELTGKAVKVRIHQRTGNLPGPVGTEVEEDHAVVVGDRALAVAHHGLDKFIGDAGGIGILHGSHGHGIEGGAFAVDHGVIGLLHPVPCLLYTSDTRTGYETGNIDNVMDGDLDGFLNAYLTQLATGELKK